MKAVKFEQVNAMIAENQEEYETLPAFIDKSDETIPLTCCFELNDEERKQVAESGKIFLTFLTFGHPLQPIGMSALNPFTNDNPE